MKDLLKVLLGLVLIAAVTYGMWRFERWWNYKYSYQSQVQDDLAPVVQRLDALEQRVSTLETNKNVR